MRKAEFTALKPLFIIKLKDLCFGKGMDSDLHLHQEYKILKWILKELL
jgi:hypothetical protein